MKKVKTNVLRLLDQAKIQYYIKEFDYDKDDNPIHIRCEKDPNEYKIYKTLVLQSNNGYLVACIPIENEVDLKLLAKASHNKYVEMIPQKNLLPLTGYIHGGCSPIGMKKKFDTYIDEKVLCEEWIAVSAGKRGMSVIVKSTDLINYVDARVVNIVK